MKNKRKICIIPVYGSIIYFFIITVRLSRIGKRNIKREFYYLIAMGILGAIGFVMSGLVFKVFRISIEKETLLFFIISMLFIWPLITLPVIEYSKKADKILQNTKMESHSPKQE